MQHTPSQQATRGAASPSEAMGGTILHRYRILASNHEGGFGTVHMCWDPRLERRVAIKRMPLQVGGGPAVPTSTLEEALREARTSSLLPHPNIVTVYDFETDGTDSYLVMEYVDGLNLAELLARVEGGTLSFDECAHVLASVASALAFAHDNGVLHLDIKPANILIDHTGAVKLADFGMASLASAAGYAGARGGTIGYMPPEQIRGELVDERSDVFSLAAVVYQALTGSCPFLAPTASESLRLIERGPQPPLSQVEPALAGAVEETLLAALEPDTRNRMASVQDLANDIVPFLGNPQEGRRSLRYLLNQAELDDHTDDETTTSHEPLLVRVPWLPSLMTRATAAACCAWLAYETLPLALVPSEEAAALGTLALAVSGAVWPPLGSALVLVIMVTTIAMQASSAAFPLALLVALAGVAWWFALGRREHLSDVALLLSGSLPLPSAGSYVAGYALAPLPAFFAGTSSWLFGTFVSTAISYGFASSPLARALLVLAREPQTWLLAIAAGASSTICALLSRSQRPVLRAAGEAACFAMLTSADALSAQMEKGSIQTSGLSPTLAIAVTLTVIMCIVTVLMGPHGRGPEGEVSDEERHGTI